MESRELLTLLTSQLDSQVGGTAVLKNNTIIKQQDYRIQKHTPVPVLQ
jgi:hypothetical protein